MALEILIFTNFSFELKEVPIKVIFDDQVVDAVRYALNWPEYIARLQGEGLDVSPYSRPFFSRYEAPRPDKEYFADLDHLQAEIREVLDLIFQTKSIPLDLWTNIFYEAEKLKEVFAPHPAVEETVYGEDLENMTFRKMVKAETFRSFLFGQLRDLIVSKNVFRIKKCPECSFFFLDRTKNQAKVYCSPDSCGNRVKQRAFNQRRRDQEPSCATY